MRVPELVCFSDNNAMLPAEAYVRVRFTLALIVLAMFVPAESHAQQTESPGHYLFAWAGDIEHIGNDFLAVIDADPASES